MRNATRLTLTIGAALLGTLLWLRDTSTLSIIVQSKDGRASRRLVESVGGHVTHELTIIQAVSARVSRRGFAELRRQQGAYRVYLDGTVDVAAKPKTTPTQTPTADQVQDTYYPALIGADRLHDLGIDGRGVGVAVVDTGLWFPSLSPFNVTAVYDAQSEKSSAGLAAELIGIWGGITIDGSGHGTHVSSILQSNRKTIPGKYNGIAPGSNLIVVRAFGANGSASYSTVIRGLDWIVANRVKHNIRVVNLSFGAPPMSLYWDDPLNQAVMRVWQAGIVVVASAGNGGPDPMTVNVPGNVPYVITVGAMTDNYTPSNGTDDFLASFSSAGPTYEGFVKPDLVAPGGHMLGLMDFTSQIATSYPQFHAGATASIPYFTMSGTSQSTAVVTGVVALMLQASPALTPSDVKCRLMSSARPAVDVNGNLAHSIFQQGAGLLDAGAAVSSTAYGCANVGLDVGLDLSGKQHYAGPASQDASGNYVIAGEPSYDWDGRYSYGLGTPWSSGYLWKNAYLWKRSVIYENAYLWRAGFLVSGKSTSSAPTAINVWVNQQ